jgi:hypothetical protein
VNRLLFRLARTDALAFHSAYEADDTQDEANYAHSCEYDFPAGDTPSVTVKEYDPTTDNNEPNRHDNIRDSHFLGLLMIKLLSISLRWSAAQSTPSGRNSKFLANWQARYSTSRCRTY